MEARQSSNSSRCSSNGSSSSSSSNVAVQHRKQRVCSSVPGALADVLARQQRAESSPPSLQLPQDLQQQQQQQQQQELVEQQQQRQELLQQLPRYFCCLFPPPPLNRRGQGSVSQERAAVRCICVEQGSSSSSNSSSKVCVACMQHYFDRLRPEVFCPRFASSTCPLHLRASPEAAAAAAAAADAADSGTAGAASTEAAAAANYAEVYCEYVQRLLPLVQQEMRLPGLPSLQQWLPSSLLGAPALRLANSSNSSNSSSSSSCCCCNSSSTDSSSSNSNSNSSRGCCCWLEEPCFFPAVFAIRGDSRFPTSRVYRQQLLHPLDAASAAAAAALRPLPGSKCLDLCCAPGNKLLLIAAAASTRPAAAAATAAAAAGGRTEASHGAAATAATAAADGIEASHTTSSSSAAAEAAAAAADGCVVGVDVSPLRMEICRRLLRKNGCTNALLVLADGRTFGTGSCCSCSSSSSRSSGVGCMQSAAAAKDTPAGGRMRRGRLAKKKEKKRQEAREVPLVSLLPQDCSSSSNSISSNSSSSNSTNSSRGGEAPSSAENPLTKPHAATGGSVRAASPSGAAGTAAAESGVPELHSSRSSSSSSSSSRELDIAAGFERVLLDVQCTHDASIRHMARLERVIRETQRQQQLYAQQHQHQHQQQQQQLQEEAPPVQGEDFYQLQQLQQQLLLRAFQLLSPEGLLVYSSCSKDRRQNEDAVLQLLQHESDALLYPLPCSGLLYDGACEAAHSAWFSGGPLRGPSGTPDKNINGCAFKKTDTGMHAPGPQGGSQKSGGPLRECLERGNVRIRGWRGPSPTASALSDGEVGAPYICPIRGAPCRGFADAYAFLEEHAVWPAAPSGLEKMPELPRHPSCWLSSSSSSSRSSRKLRPSSCQFLEEKGHTSGIFLCCITKKMPQSRTLQQD
ncbi:hypothetical protein ACSSS7_000316 [Eimeria intestinalis]